MNDLDYMYFSELAHTLSFSRAADNLCITQSALSRCIAKMEKELSARLFSRDRHEVSLTPAGEVLLENWANVEKAQSMLRQAVRNAERLSVRDTVRIGIQHGHLIPLSLHMKMKEFSTASRPVGIQLVSLPYRDLFRQLRDGMIDVALAFDFPFTDRKGLESTVLLREELSILVSPVDPVLKTTDPDERRKLLSGMNILLTGKQHQETFFPFLLEECRKNGIEPKGVQYYPTHMDMANALLMEKGFLVLNRTEVMKGASLIPLEKSGRMEFRAWWDPADMHPLIKEFTEMLGDL